MHHPWRPNVTTSMVGLENGNIRIKSYPKYPQRYILECRRRRRRTSAVVLCWCLQTCLPVHILPYLYGNLPAVQMYAHIFQNTDKEFPKSTEIATWTNPIRCQWSQSLGFDGSYRSLTFAYFKPFPGLKYMAGPDWPEKFVKPMNIDFASKLYGS